MNIGVVLAGGCGSRFGGDLPKQYLLIGKEEVINFPIETLQKNKKIDKIIVVAHQQYQKNLKEKYNVEVCDGGKDRNISVFNALEYIREKNYNCENIIFVDSARPLLSQKMINQILELLKSYDGVITCQKITDSLCFENKLINREKYCLVQTPEAFKFKSLSEFKQDSLCTAIFEQAKIKELGKMFIEENNLKITYPNDLLLAEKLLN